MASIVESESDPLSVVAGWVVDPSLPIETRLTAASVCLPFLYPKLSASHVDSRLTVTKLDSSDLIRKLDERLARLAQPAVIDARAVEQPAVVVTGDDEPE
jgi:hypothetical protein